MSAAPGVEAPAPALAQPARPPRAALVSQLAKFGAVGAVGVVVNLAVFNGLMLIPGLHLTGKAFYATTIATLVAIGANWAGNRYWAFAADRRAGATREGIEFLIVSVAAMAIPLLCVWVTHLLVGPDDLLADNIAANVVGLALGTAFRFAFYRWWVFSPRRTGRGEHAS